MNKVYQPIYSKNDTRKGNCLRACLASFFDVHIDSMPEFENMHKSEFMAAVRQWVGEQGYDIIIGNGHLYDDQYYFVIVTYDCEKGEDPCHCTIFKNGQLFHDPNPNQSAILEIRRSWVFVKRTG
jgi:hypothetical protein